MRVGGWGVWSEFGCGSVLYVRILSVSTNGLSFCAHYASYCPMPSMLCTGSLCIFVRQLLYTVLHDQIPYSLKLLGKMASSA